MSLGSSPISDAKVHLRSPRLAKLFDAARKYEASDLIIKANTHMKLRVRGKLKSVDIDPFDHHEMEDAVSEFLTPAQNEFYRSHGAIDIAFDLDADNRFRINIFRARGKSVLVARRVSSKIMDFADLNLPPILGEICSAQQGLILLAGVTGSGKSTTIASMINHINATRPCHIVTIEDPIEYIFKDQKAIINQREVGVDVNNFEDALRSVVRENPDVIFIGEMRDRETFRTAVHAAETGHLVFGTIHASAASQVFSRVYNLFPPEERDLIRHVFANNLIAICYQMLLESLSDTVQRVPAIEILLANPAVRKAIEEGREDDIPELIKKSRGEGMLTLSDSLVELAHNEYIHPKTAIAAAHNADEVRMRLKGIRTSMD